MTRSPEMTISANGRARCGTCYGDYALTNAGRIRTHKSGMPATPCAGSKQPPATGPAPAGQVEP